MITLPTNINITRFATYLSALYPPHLIDNGVRQQLLQTAYTELYLLYDLASVDDPDTIEQCTYIMACYIWRSEGSRSARLDLQSQRVVTAGVVKESYDLDAPVVPPAVATALEAYKRTVALQLVQRTRAMDDGIVQ